MHHTSPPSALKFLLSVRLLPRQSKGTRYQAVSFLGGCTGYCWLHDRECFSEAYLDKGSKSSAMVIRVVERVVVWVVVQVREVERRRDTEKEGSMKKPGFTGPFLSLDHCVFLYLTVRLSLLSPVCLPIPPLRHVRKISYLRLYLAPLPFSRPFAVRLRSTRLPAARPPASVDYNAAGRCRNASPSPA
jgi:hypothetical protein